MTAAKKIKVPHTVTPAPAPVLTEVPPPAGADKAALFKRAFAYDDAIKALLTQIESLKTEKSAAIKEILDACGKGPFSYKGRELTISAREGTHFFKEYGRRDLEEID